MSITASHLQRAAEISIEEAYEMAATLSGVERRESGGVEIISGFHEEHGAIHIVIPPASNGMLLLPFAIQDF